MLANRKDITGYSVTRELDTRNPLLHVQYLSMPFKPYCLMSLNKDGELTLGFGRIPLKELFAQRGLTATYEFFRMSLLARMYDNVVPREVDGSVPSFTTWKKTIEEGRLRGESPIDTIRKIILPRIRYSKDIRKINEAIKQEERKALRAFDQQGQKGTHRFCGRVGYRKPVRPGYHAPEYLRLKALEEADYVLKEGETWVRKSRPGIQLPRIIPDTLFFKKHTETQELD